jgi:5-methylcytosine-specific restriction endonuclease McrA
MAAEILRQIRTVVIERARGQCEYCQKPDDRDLNFYRHEVDHVIAETPGGKATLEHLAYACCQCKR